MKIGHSRDDKAFRERNRAIGLDVSARKQHTLFPTGGDVITSSLLQSVSRRYSHPCRRTEAASASVIDVTHPTKTFNLWISIDSQELEATDNESTTKDLGDCF